MNNIIKIEKRLCFSCLCIIPEINNHYSREINKLSLNNCLLRFLETSYNKLYNDLESKFILYIKDYPAELKSDFLKHLHYSFIYRIYSS